MSITWKVDTNMMLQIISNHIVSCLGVLSYTHISCFAKYVDIGDSFKIDSAKVNTAFTKSMEAQIHVLILTPVFPLFKILLILLIGNIIFLRHTKYQTCLWNILEVMAFNMTEGWIPKSALSLFELKSTFFFVIWNLDFKYRFCLLIVIDRNVVTDH